MKVQGRFSRMAQMAAATAALASVFAFPAKAQQLPASPTYVDLIEMSRAANIVARIAIEEQITVPPERAPDVAPGQVRLYIEALTQALLGGSVPVGESLVFLVDQPLDFEGDAPDIEEMSFLVFARAVPGRPGEIQLVGGNSFLPDTPRIEQRIRMVLTQLATETMPPQVTGVREVISVPGNLAGESETQIFLETQGGAPVSLNVLRRPGMRPQWGVSWTEIVDQAARPPEPETLQWYSLACFLPERLPDESFLQADRDSQARAREDYGLIQDQLGPCARSR